MALTIVVGLNVLLEEYESFTNLRTSIHLEQYVHIQIGGKTQAKFTGPHDEVTADFYRRCVPAPPIMTFSLPF